MNFPPTQCGEVVDADSHSLGEAHRRGEQMLEEHSLRSAEAASYKEGPQARDPAMDQGTQRGNGSGAEAPIDDG